MTESTETMIQRFEIESKEKWDDMIPNIPALHFKKDWDIKIIPPFGGAVARFLVEKDGYRVCSVYLDWYGRLGAMDQPYYELYPWEDDVKRYYLNEVDEMMEDIETLIKSRGTKIPIKDK